MRKNLRSTCFFFGVALSKLARAVEKTSGTATGAGGRERPQKLFGRLKAEKAESLPPDLVFFPRRFLRFSLTGSTVTGYTVPYSVKRHG